MFAGSRSRFSTSVLTSTSWMSAPRSMSRL
ncbi:Uncharacterised protein [Mycobacteroides abscessus]|nr:Uncharacterised protein [Mycobacteroides abscessus]